MTYIEFFDSLSLNNICACLTDTPDRVIFIGDNSKLMKKHIEKYDTVFKARGNRIEFLYKTVSKSDLDNVVHVLSELVEAYDDCAFGITGGEEVYILALGMLRAHYSWKNFQIHRFNLKNGTICDCDEDGATIYKYTPLLSIDENIRIYGGDVVYGGIGDPATYKWDLTEEFLCDVDKIWNVCKNDVRYWNIQCGVFGFMESGENLCSETLTTVVSHSALEQYLSRHKYLREKSRSIINALVSCGLIKYREDEKNGTVSVTYKNKMVKKCLTKAGQALEMKVYVSAVKLAEDDGTPVYNDAMNGVVIDWDGEFSNELSLEKYNTENEIDVMLMHGVIPVFISCKNGIVSSDELYKLDTVAKRFGGEFSKKVLVATALDSLGEAGFYLRQRAKDMNIRIVENIQNLDDGEISRLLKNVWN